MKQKMEMEHPKELKNSNIDANFLTEVLSNHSLIRWVALNNAENIQIGDEIKVLKDEIQLSNKSLSLMSVDNVSMLLTNARLKVKPIATFSLEQLQKIIRVVGTNGTIKILKEDYPCVIESEDKQALVVLAPRIANED